VLPGTREVVHNDGKTKRGVNKSNGINGEILGTTSDGTGILHGMLCNAGTHIQPIESQTSRIEKD